MIIHTTGYPRSGNTWLGKLLTDATGGLWLPAETAEKTQVFDLGNYETEFVNPEIVVTKNHKMEFSDNNPVVFIYRDPRDVAVSAWHYRSKNSELKEFVTKMISVHQPELDLYGPYEKFIRSWWNKASAQVSYEQLYESPQSAIEKILVDIGLGEMIQRTGWNEHISNSIKRQSFSTVRNSNLEMFSHVMRKGIVGDWRNYFDAECLAIIQDGLGELMLEQGYN